MAEEKKKEEMMDLLRRTLIALKGTTCYPDKTRIYAPTCYGKCIDAVNELIEKIDKLFGGSTVYDAEGHWFDIENNVIWKEPEKVIEVGHGCLSEEQARKLAEIIAEYGEKAQQYELFIERGNQFYLFSRKEFTEAVKRLSPRVTVL